MNGKRNKSAQTYAAENPLGGPAKVFDAMAAAIRAGDAWEDVLHQFGFAEVKSSEAAQRQQKPVIELFDGKIVRSVLEPGYTGGLYKAPPAPVRLTNGAVETAAQEQVAQRWELDEDACKFLVGIITADPEEITRVGFYLGYVKDDDGQLVHGFGVYEAEYPEEGVEMLVETTPLTPTPEAVRKLIEKVDRLVEMDDAPPMSLGDWIDAWNEMKAAMDAVKGKA